MRRMTGTVQPYAWGSTTAIPEFLGQPPNGRPQAELWLGAHPAAPSELDGGDHLDDVVYADPAGTVGATSVRRFGARLPYLMKVLAAAQPLSLQAHPTREEAEQGYARERRANIPLDAPDRSYKDEWPKPEMMCPLSEVHALCGFREPAKTYALFGRLGVEEAVELVAPLADGGPDELREVFGRLLRLGEADHGVVAQVVAAASEAQTDDPGDSSWADFVRTALELDQFYPGDVGILAALLMNRLRIGPGEGLFLPPGNLHAYLSGTGVEIMANSDNVLRGGLTSKHVAVDELLGILDFTPGVPDLVRTVEEDAGVFRYLTPAPEFALWRVEVGGLTRPAPASGAGRIVLCTDGRVVLDDGGSGVVLERGETAFVLPDERPRIGGVGTVFVGAPGV